MDFPVVSYFVKLLISAKEKCLQMHSNNIQLYKQLNIEMDQFQNYTFLNYYTYQTAIPETYNLGLSNFQQPSNTLAENAKIKAENLSLTEQLEKLTQYNKKLKSQNLRLKKEYLNPRQIKKRRYTPRRPGLEKKFVCGIEGCTKNYSSKIALKNHHRGVHKLKTKLKNA